MKVDGMKAVKDITVSDCARSHLDVDVQDYKKQNEVTTADIEEALKTQG